MKRKTVIVVGAILLILGSAGLVFGISQVGDVREGIQDPENDALETLEFDSGGGSKTVYLEEGEYDIWTEEGEEVDTLQVTDGQGSSVFERDEGQTITISERAYDKLGNLDIQEDGEYTFETDERSTLYVTDHYPFFDFFGSLCGMILLIPISIVLVIAGAGLVIWKQLGNKDCPYCGGTICNEVF